MHATRLFFSAIAACFVVSCTAAKQETERKTIEQDENKFFSFSRHKLSDEDIAQNEKLALNGNVDAIEKLRCHYDMYEFSSANSAKWLLLGAKAGGENFAKRLKYCAEEPSVLNYVKSQLMPCNAFRLSPAQICAYLKDGNSDGAKAFWLFLFYKFCEHDSNATAEKWRSKAEISGVVLAKKEYWTSSQDSQDKWCGFVWTTQMALAHSK